MFSLDLLVIEQIKEQQKVREEGRRLQVPIPEPKLKPKVQEEDEPKRVIIIEL